MTITKFYGDRKELPKKMEDIFLLNVNFSKTAINFLISIDTLFLSGLINWTEGQLLSLNGGRRKTINEIKNYLYSIGLSLREDLR